MAIKGSIKSSGNSLPDRERVAVQAARQAAGHVRLALAKFYLSGEFGRPDIKSAYAWVLASWNRWDGDFDEKVDLAKCQQFLEFLLSDADRREAALLIENLLSDEQSVFLSGNPFNAGWWGWSDDDPVPPGPPERYFKEELVLWLKKAGWRPADICSTLEGCRPCLAPSNSGRKQWDLFTTFESCGELPWDKETQSEYQAWLAARRQPSS